MSEENKTCDTCCWWEKDKGSFSFNAGWTGQYDDRGHCCYMPQKISKRAKDKCHNWEKADYENGL